MKRPVSRICTPLLFVCTLIMSACSGGSGGGLPVQQPTLPPPGPTQTSPATITIDLPGGAGTSSANRSSQSSKKKTSASVKPQYADTGSGSQLVVTVASSNGNPVHQSTSYAFTGGTGTTPVTCTSASPPVCTLSTSLPVGLDVIQITLEDASNHPIGQGEVSAQVTQGSNTINSILNGIVATVNPPTCGGTVTYQNDGEHIPVTWGASSGNAAANDADQAPQPTLSGLATGTGGTFLAGTYLYKVIFKNSAVTATGSNIPAYAEVLTAQSAEASVAVAAYATQVGLTIGTVPSASSAFMDIYRSAAGGASGSEELIASNVAASVSYTDTNLPAGTVALPASVAIGTPGLYGATAPTDAAQLLNPLTIASTNAQAKFSVNGGPAVNPAVINGPGDNIAIIYSGSQVAGTVIPLTLGASVANSVPGLSAVAQVASSSCTVAGNSSITGPPTTLIGTGAPGINATVNDLGTWTLQNGANSGQQPSAFNGDCFEPSSGSTIGLNDAQCYYAVSGTLGGFTATSTPGVVYNMQYTGSILLNYWRSGALTNPAAASGTYLFVDTNNPRNKFTGTLSGPFMATTAPTSSSNGQLNASLESALNAGTIITWTISGTGGAFTGVTGTITEGPSAFTNKRDATYPQQFDYPASGNIAVNGTLNGI